MWQLPLFSLHRLFSRPINRLKKTSKRRSITTRTVRRCYSDELYTVWRSLVASYFPGRLDLYDYKLRWSTRSQKRVLGSCHLRKREVIIARELNHPDYLHLLEPLIYHELCHAVFGLTPALNCGKRQWHGKEFRAIERKHPSIQILDQWIKSGGWIIAVRRDRGRRAALKRLSVK